jgi:hypothetical protein
MNGKLLMMVALVGCVGELEIETEMQSETAAARKAGVVSCYELEDRNAICQVGEIRFESKDLGLRNCIESRKGLSCDALRVDSPNLPPELWEAGSSNGGVWKTTYPSSLTCIDAALLCDTASPMHCWCGSDRRAQGGNVEFEWKVEQGES